MTPGMDTLTPKQRADVEALQVQMDAERNARNACSDCGTVMERKATISECDGQGRGAEYLFQCPKCKNIETRDRS